MYSIILLCLAMMKDSKRSDVPLSLLTNNDRLACFKLPNLLAPIRFRLTLAEKAVRSLVIYLKA